VLYDPTSLLHHRLARVVARLDLRRALEFADIRAPAAALAGELPAEREPEIEGRSFVVWKRPAPKREPGKELAAANLLTGSAGAGAVVAALPLGALYAWTLRIPPLRAWMDGLLSTPHPS